MASVEVRFPTNISQGSAGGPGYRTSIVTLDSGAEERVGHYAMPRHAFDVRFGVRSFADVRAVRDFYIARRGPAVAFRFKDWLDYSSDSDSFPGSSTPGDTDVQIGVGDASDTTFQLVKFYTDAGGTVTRNITKPVSGSVVIALDGTPTASGWTVDTTTGIVTFTSAPGLGVVITAGFEFDVPVRFGGEIDRAFLLSADSFEALSTVPIPLVEVINEAPCNEEVPAGGAATVALAANGSFTRATGRFLKVTPASGSLTYTQSELASALPLGGPVHRIYNASGTHALVIKDSAANTIVSIPATESRQLWIADGGSGTKQWTAFA